ncbi:MAG: hypothetical protein WEC12_04375 [Balneolaceae bacterium]
MMIYTGSNSLLAATLLAGILISCDTQPTQTEADGEFSHARNPGSSNADLLTDSDFDRLVVEIDYMEGARPTDEAIDSLRVFLVDKLQKSEIIIEEPTQIPSGGQANYTAEDVRDLEESHRSTYSDTESRILATYNVFVDGEYSDGNVLGIAYYNTSNAFFGETINSISGGLAEPSRRKVEATVFRHEYGHLMGLVNNGTELQSSHQDESNGAHCTDEECLMHYAFETADLFGNLFDGTIPDLNELCEADIQAVEN